MSQPGRNQAAVLRQALHGPIVQGLGKLSTASYFSPRLHQQPLSRDHRRNVHGKIHQRPLGQRAVTFLGARDVSAASDLSQSQPASVGFLVRPRDRADADPQGSRQCALGRQALTRLQTTIADRALQGREDLLEQGRAVSRKVRCPHNIMSRTKHNCTSLCIK